MLAPRMAVPKNPRGTLLLLVEAELAAAGSREHRVELRSDVSHSVLNLRAQVSRHSQVFCVDAMKKLSDHINIPLASGEANYGIYEFKQLIERQALSFRNRLQVR